MDTGRESESRADGRRAGRRRRGPVLVGTGILLVAGVSTVGALGLGGGGADAGQAGQSRSSQAVPVTRGTLTDQTEIDGRLGHGPEVPFPVKAKGTVTWLPETDRTIRRGGTVLRVDDRPVVLLYGSLPMYRDLGMVEQEPATTGGGEAGGSGEGAEDADGTKNTDGGADGAKGADGVDDIDGGTPPGRQPAPPAAPTPLRGMDVKQFETNLQALGYSGFTVDDTYTTLTADAVKRWQKDLGVPGTGKVDAGDIVYASGPVRIAGTSVRVGAEAAGSPVSYTRTSRMVTVAAPAADTDWARRGSEVTVELPDGRSVQGKVASVGKDASAAEGEGNAEGEDGGDDAGTKAATVSVVITFDDQESLGRMESGPVTVRYVVEQRKGVLTVPVAALVALAEGGHGLELADGSGKGADGENTDGASRFVPVKTGLFANGRVEVSGPEVHEGMKVRIPK
ncbi:peptidoglycan-binding domain-containing protein [Streptomyces ochraceiscleroticus]|uniref:Peptidoglycan-binding protein n=1 Tax=Streptomyces ochraceiscleroticus TaxID=47761 RepID=A0ABW1MKM7_9ACTN|nr:peptidoglycan-binding domain-containing protein [Streptomyces ochraceiscleroticus]